MEIESNFDVITEAQQCVKFGAHWLDEQMPGWERKVSLADLDVSSSCSCVMGQLVCAVADEIGESHPESPYDEIDDDMCGYEVADTLSDTLRERGLIMSYYSAQRRGFHAGYGGADYDSLTAAWKKLIEERHAEGL